MNPSSKKNRFSQTLAKSIILVIFVAFIIWFVPNSRIPISYDFEHNLWNPSYLLINHLNPYDIEGYFSGLNPLWFPMSIGLFFPLGYLPLQWASNVWMLVNIIVLTLIVVLSVKPSQERKWLRPASLFSLVLFPATIAHFQFGQISLIICLDLLLISKYRLIFSPVFIGLLIALSLTKPQLVVIFLPVYLICYYVEQGLKKFSRILLFTCLWTAVLCLPLLMVSPSWVPQLVSNLKENPLWLYPTLYTYLALILGLNKIIYIVAALYLAIGMGTSIILLFKIDRYDALLWSMSLTPLFSPVLFTSDFVLMFPLLLSLISLNTKSRTSDLIVLIGYWLCTVTFFVTIILGWNSFHKDVWVPIFFNIVLVAGYLSRLEKSNKIPLITT